MDQAETRTPSQTLPPTALTPPSSQWVVTAARQVAGAAIAGLRPGLTADLLPRLLDAFCAASAAVGQGAVEVKRACAAAFADVLAKVRGSVSPRDGRE